ncbi:MULTISPECIES: SPFH domain-containing protein [unclassified Streptomyces]|uniref:SPFH domain-containing protein n=1 Tax=unclassified Streptomyces TaxID=2593676 RepID=UPI000823AEC5|nr:MULTISPECIES: SPFH domain-containing protein [unclassified Streptomyces]SCK63524.1 Membrane protease subunits, stomatin/prohibitin homologs [Streptomyces sp. AmelKG-E11A]
MSPVAPQSPQSPHPPQPSPSAKAPLPARTPQTAPRISRSPQTPAPEPSGQRPRSPRGDEPGGQRPSRLIHNESTTEIPVHLLFREDPSGTPVPAEPAVVRRRQASGEQPRTPSGGRGPRDDGRAAAGDFQERPGAAAARRERAFEQGGRPLPVTDPELVERLGRALPGTAGVAAGFLGLAGLVVALWWTGALPTAAVELLGLPAYGADAGPVGVGLDGITSRSGITAAGAVPLGIGHWALLAVTGTLALFGFGGLARGRVGQAWVLTLFGRYRGSVRRTGLVWVNPLLLRRRVDVRLRHWRSEPMPAVDAHGVALRVVVLVVWRIRDTAKATLTVEDHQEYLRECVEAAMARVLSQLPADAFHEDAPTLRNAEAVGDALTRRIAADTRPVGLEVFSAQPTRIEYAPEVAAAMQRRRIAALDAQHRDSVLTSVVDSVEDTVTRLTVRGLVELDDYERKALVKDLTVAFYTGRGTADPG